MKSRGYYNSIKRGMKSGVCSKSTYGCDGQIFGHIIVTLKLPPGVIQGRNIRKGKLIIAS